MELMSSVVRFATSDIVTLEPIIHPSIHPSRQHYQPADDVEFIYNDKERPPHHSVSSVLRVLHMSIAREQHSHGRSFARKFNREAPFMCR